MHFDHLKIPKLLLKCIGLNLPFIWRILYNVVYTIFNLLFFYLALTHLICIRHDISLFSVSMEGVTHYIHWIGKFIALFINQSRLLYLLDQTKHFWPINNTNDFKILNRFVLIAKFFTGLAFLVMVSFFIYSLLSKDHQLPILMDIPNFLPNWFGYVQYPIDIIMAQTVTLLDIMFLLLCGGCIIQLRMLCRSYNLMDFTENDINTQEKIQKKLTKLIQHHVFILKYCSEIGKLVTFGFFSQYAVCTLTVCFELFLIVQLQVPVYMIVRGLIYTFTLTVELGLYCGTAQYLTNEIEKVGESIYNMKWYKSKSNSIRKQVILLLSSIQNRNNFKAGGILSIDMATFCQVFKTAFSVYTCLKTVTDNSMVKGYTK